jgi:hypothetical protein
MDGLIIFWGCPHFDSRPQHPQFQIQVRRLFHHVGARQIVATQFQDGDQRFGALGTRYVVLISQARL